MIVPSLSVLACHPDHTSVTVPTQFPLPSPLLPELRSIASHLVTLANGVFGDLSDEARHKQFLNDYPIPEAVKRTSGPR